MKKLILPYIIVLVLFLLIDLPIILYFNKPIYDKQFNRINKCSNNEISNLQVYSSAIIAYLLLALGIYIFIIRPEMNTYKQDYLNIIIQGMILGLVVYGVYNGTNMATIKEWGVKEFIIDTVWGTILSGTIAGSSVYIVRYFDL